MKILRPVFFMAFLLDLSVAFSLDDFVQTCPSPDDSLVKKLMETFGAGDNEIQKAPCKTKAPPSLNEIDAYINMRAKGSVTETIHGVRFENESPELIGVFAEFTTLKNDGGNKLSVLGQDNIQIKYKINPACSKVMCALEKIWGKEFSKKMMYLRLKHNYNASEIAFESSDRFTIDELNDVIIAADDLPPHLNDSGVRGQRLTHYTRGLNLPLYGEQVVEANAIIMLFDAWDMKSYLERQYTVFHEISHIIARRKKRIDESSEWTNLSGWVKKGDEWQADRNACFISKYAEFKSPLEDFAESFATYRYNGARFKDKCPEKYQFLKTNIFKGAEYIDPENCPVNRP